MAKRRPGRKRLSGPRTASGRHIPARDAIDRGSDLLQAQRAAMVRRDDGTSGDTVMASYPLGALLASGSIDQEQHDAGVKYAKLRAILVGRSASPPALVMDGDKNGRAPEDDAEAEARRAASEHMFRAAAAALQACGSRVKTVVDNASVHSRYPHWLVSATIRGSDARDALALGAGLECLAVVFGMREQRRAA